MEIPRFLEDLAGAGAADLEVEAWGIYGAFQVRQDVMSQERDGILVEIASGQCAVVFEPESRSTASG